MKKTQFLHPKFITTWIFILLMRACVFIPFKAQLILSKALSYLLILFSHQRYKIAKINITKCFSNLSSKNQTKILKEHMRDNCMGFFEIAMCLYASSKKINKLYNIRNKNIVEEAITNKDNIILLSGHFTTLLMIDRILVENFNIAISYRPLNNKLLEHIVLKWSQKHNCVLIDFNKTKTLITKLKSGIPVCYHPDQDLSDKKNVFAPFFGVQTNTVTATARLSRISNAKIIHNNFYRNNDGYIINFELVENFPTNDEIADATRINSLIEKQAMHSLSQYLWAHKRFKTRPDKEKNFY